MSLDEIIAQIQLLVQQREELAKFLPKLSILMDKLYHHYEQLQEIDSKYRNKGYISNGQTLDKGVLLNCANVLGNDNVNILNVINKNYDRINEINAKIAQLQELYYRILYANGVNY